MNPKISLSFAVLVVVGGLVVAGQRPVRAGEVTPPSGYKVLDPIRHGNLTVFPVVAAKSYPTGEFLTLDEGLRSGEVVVTEAGSVQGLIRRNPSPAIRHDGAQVNRLVLVNNSRRPLLLLAGEIRPAPSPAAARRVSRSPSSSRPPASPSRDSSARSAPRPATCSSQCRAGPGWPTMSSWNPYRPCYGRSARWRYPESRPGSHVTSARSKNCWKAPAQPPKSVRDVRDRAKPSGGRTAAWPPRTHKNRNQPASLRRILRPTGAHNGFVWVRTRPWPTQFSCAPNRYAYSYSLPLLVPACLFLDGPAGLPQMPPEGV